METSWIMTSPPPRRLSWNLRVWWWRRWEVHMPIALDFIQSRIFFMQKALITMLRSWEELSLAKEHYTSFLIVRDPLDRLISCYRDKMVSNVTLLISNTTQSRKKQQFQFQKTTKLNSFWFVLSFLQAWSSKVETASPEITNHNQQEMPLLAAVQA